MNNIKLSTKESQYRRKLYSQHHIKKQHQHELDYVSQHSDTTYKEIYSLAKRFCLKDVLSTYSIEEYRFKRLAKSFNKVGMSIFTDHTKTQCKPVDDILNEISDKWNELTITK